MNKQNLISFLEAKGLSFTVNVITSGCSKPVTKMRTIVDLLNEGHDVRQSFYDTMSILVDGWEVDLIVLNDGIGGVLEAVSAKVGPLYEEA